ncbi:DUF1287 domain-containing protein [Vallitalea okinawensis]|uniref:DUF1287 domain-containing protein n=1 Tax=Vallitalea okinawensis TaxID=2078660 RepID=UPI000CFE16B9|nr:DUF1287 domain-containing protein [Vallitalea okinawensis]
MKKFFLRIVILGILFAGFLLYEEYMYGNYLYFLQPTLRVETITLTNDKDGDGVTDLKDIVEGAREEIKNKTTYHSDYYDGGYPPEDEGVCTDVIWRALANAGYNLKEDMDQDIANHLEDYPRVDKPDPNIDFRRVKNQFVFFSKYAETLTTTVEPYNASIMSQWQPGDIVVLKKPDHIAIISDRRRKDGVPYIIHNSWTVPKEQNLLLKWYEEGHIVGHFRYYEE